MRKTTMLDSLLSDNIEDEDTQKDKYLTFRIIDKKYAIFIKYIVEIISIQKITEVPDLPKFVKGVINLRGQVIPLIDLRTLFNLSETVYGDRTCFIIIEIENNIVGLAVDLVHEVIIINESSISAPPPFQPNSGSGFIEGIAKYNEEIIIIIDVNKIMHDNILEKLTN